MLHLPLAALGCNGSLYVRMYVNIELPSACMPCAMSAGRYTGAVPEDSCHEFEQNNFVYNT